MLTFHLLEVNNNKYSSDFRHSNFFSFDAVGGACLSGLVCPVVMSSFCIQGGRGLAAKPGSVYCMPETSLTSMKSQVTGHHVWITSVDKTGNGLNQAKTKCSVVKVKV